MNSEDSEDIKQKGHCSTRLLCVNPIFCVFGKFLVVMAHCLVTVGTTKFDELIIHFNAEASSISRLLLRKGFSTLRFQFGRGSVEPDTEAYNTYGLQCTAFRFSDTFHDDILRSHLVISHAGAGTILESLRCPPPKSSAGHNARRVHVCINGTLMENHQAEIADILYEKGILSRGFPGTIVEDLAYLIEHKDADELSELESPQNAGELLSSILLRDLGIN